MSRRLPRGPILAPTVQQLDPGTDRYAFVLIGPAHHLIEDAPVAVYLARSGATRTRGPFVAHTQSLGVSPRFESQTTKRDPPPPRSLYVAHLPLPSPGVYSMLAVVKVANRVQATQPVRATVSAHDPVPTVGQRAPLIQTSTTTSVDGDLAAIDTRQPPDDMHATNYAAVYGKRPIVLVFAAPGLCQVSICRPAADIAMEVEHDDPGEATFIHNEIYEGNAIKPGCVEGTRPAPQCYRPQFRAFHLETAPWVFVIDRHGRVAARLEGPFSKNELQAAITRAVPQPR